MNPSIVKELVSSFESGEMDELEKSIIPFFTSHKEEFYKFIEVFQSEHGKKPLEFLIKYFILSNNMPFSMELYLKDQSKKIIDDINNDKDSVNDRNKKISKWIHKKAANYRSHSILRQIICFDKKKENLIPEIRKKLNLPEDP